MLWEQHCCLPLTRQADLGQLDRYRRPGGSYVSVNAGYAPSHGHDFVTDLLADWRPRIEADDRFRLVGDLDDLDSAQITVGFDLENSAPLEGDLNRVREFYDLGVRTMLPAYNNRNAAGGGCLDAVDDGLTAYGRDLIRELNAVGMVADGSHCGARTALDISDVTTKPMIYSHSCMRSLWDHPRNITDEQARACAATGGVVGITGIGIFLGPNDASLDAFVRHIDYAVELVGPEHVGLSSDFSFDADEVNAEVAANPELFPDWFTRWGPITFTPPEGLLAVEGALRSRGYPEDAITAILGGNFRRVAAACWA
ncbi:dipeptidase [Actinoplanes rectilineatus]|uniref:dipeptidase n=1 Tax=Actinoplanes rectilineatus TaxID=113571 RepID=UPI0009F83AF4|nr:membrane dipeptidase [Actinoplanes rectilineatus]